MQLGNSIAAYKVDVEFTVANWKEKSEVTSGSVED
jgi:hypothetical protein